MTRVRQAAALAIAAAVVAVLPAPAQAAVDLVGTWYVLIHYRDSATNNPDFDRWLDRVWKIEKKGSRLHWTEYPIVVFNDQAGRFERFHGVRSRVLSYWQPNATQLAQIEAGLEINTRGSKSKSLRGSPAKGYKSTTRMRAQSANVIGYVEHWSIEDVEGKPVFTFDDMMGSGRTETMEGRTRYTTAAIGDDGNLLEGTYNRDGTRIGTFQLIRAGQVARVAGKSKKVERERQQLRMEGLQRQMERGEISDVGDSGDKPMSAEERAVSAYVLSLPPDQRDALLAQLDGKSPADRERIMQEHFAKLPPEEMQRLLAGDDGDRPVFSRELGQPSRKDIQRAIENGMKLPQVLEVVKASPKQIDGSVTLQQLEVVRLGATGAERIDPEDIESGRFQPDSDASYGVVARRFCRSARGSFLSVQWYLLPKNSLRAWDHNEMLEGCAVSQRYEPARGSNVALERELIAYRQEKVRGGQVLKAQLYEKGLALLAAGRIEDAEDMLARADAKLDSGPEGIAGSSAGRIRSKLASRSDTQALREQLVQALAEAKKAAAAPPGESANP